jgi:hypothetical protein
MPLWFEIAALVLLGCIAVSLIDLCFALQNVTRNISNFGIRFETEVLPRFEAAIRNRDHGVNLPSS